MNPLYRSIAALEYIARNTLNSFDPTLLYGPPSAVPIEKLAAHLGLWIEYQCIRKTGSILGELVYEKSLVPLYLRDIKCYDLVTIDGKTIILDESLLKCKTDGRLRFTCAHEIAHWLLHRDLYIGMRQAAALGNPNKSSEEDPVIEWQANKLGQMLLLPKVQVKKSFFAVRNDPDRIMILKEHFNVSADSIEIFIKDHNLA